MKYKIYEKKIMFCILPCFLYWLFPLFLAAQDTLYYQGFEGDLCSQKLHGFKQYNNLNHLHQNVWAKGDTTPGYVNRGSGINGGASNRFRLNRWPAVASCFPDTNVFDTCTRVFNANFNGKRGAHIITGAVLNRGAQLEKTYLLNEQHTGYYMGGGSQSSATYVGLYDPRVIYKKGTGMVRLQFWTRSNGEENRDYGLVQYSLLPEIPNGELFDNEIRSVPIQGVWRIARYDIVADSLVSGSNPRSFDRFTLTDKTRDAQKEKLQNIVNWTKVQYTLPPNCAHSPNLRIGYFWVNDDNGKGAFPALTLDDIAVVAYPFNVDIQLASYCFSPGSLVPLSFSAHAAIYDYQPGGAAPSFLIAELSDESGEYGASSLMLARIPIAQLRREGDFFKGETVVQIPSSLTPGSNRKIRIRFEHNDYYGETPLFPISPIAASIVPPLQLVCPGASAELRLEKLNGNNQVQVFDTSITWYKMGNPRVLGRGLRLTLPIVTRQDTGKYYASFTYRNAMNNICQANTNYSEILFRRTAPVALNLPAAIKRICRYDTVQLSGGSPQGGKYSYSLGGANFIESSDLRFTDAGLSFENFQYVVRYTIRDEASNCDVSAFDTIAVLNIPLGQIISADGINIICDRPITLLARLAGAGHNNIFSPDSITYQWLGAASNTNQAMASAPGVYGVKVGYLYRGKNGLPDKVCYNKPELGSPLSFPSLEIGFEPLSLPAPSIDAELSVGSSVVKGSITGLPPNTTLPEIAIELNNQFLGTARLNIADRSWTFILPRPLQNGDEIKAYAIIKPNCKGGETRSQPVAKIIRAFDEVRVYTAFSPNGDGYNDFFEIDNIILHPNAELTIFNRWGQEVYKAKGYRNNWAGEDLPDGTYYYVLDLKNGNPVLKGYVTLLR
jgi:gliding motility-associated-like protein